MFLKDILQIGSIDLNFIEKYYAVIADDFDSTPLNEIPLGQLDANVIIYEIFNSINQSVFHHIQSELRDETIQVSKRKRTHLLKLCEDRITKFAPFINCIDSWFNNELDKVSIEG